MPVISYKTQLAKQIYITFFFLGGGAEQEYTHILFRTFKMNPAATATVTLKYGHRGHRHQTWYNYKLSE